MPGTPTPFYNLQTTISTDPMPDFENAINANWDKLTDIPGPPSVTSLPTSGNYNLGSRVYLSTTQSIYVLVCASVDWGWHWRPVHDALSPWVTIPTSVLNVAGWNLNALGTFPFSIALDNRGMCYWRGAIGPSAGSIARNSSVNLFKPLPEGFRPREGGVYSLGHEVLSVSNPGTGGGLTSFQGGRIYINNDGGNSIRVYGGTADPVRLFLSGCVRYAMGDEMYTIV